MPKPNRPIKKVPDKAAIEPVEADVRLRLHGSRDVMRDAEGVLVVYDPQVVTEKVLAELTGMSRICYPALVWMAGHVGQPSAFAPINEFGIQPLTARKTTAKQVARLVELGWQRAIATIPIGVDINGLDLQVRTSGLTSDQRKSQQAKGREKAGQTSAQKPRISYISITGNKIAFTWDWIFNFSPTVARKKFGKSIAAQVVCAPGDYMLRAWQFAELEDTETGGAIPQWLMQLQPISNDLLPPW